jgi:UDP-glucose 4-epimerase
MDTSRVRDELGWEPRRTAGETILESLAGMRDEAGLDTPPLRP